MEIKGNRYQMAVTGIIKNAEPAIGKIYASWHDFVFITIWTLQLRFEILVEVG